MTTKSLSLDSMFRPSSTARQVAEALVSGKEWTRKELEEEFGVKKTNVYRVMATLREAGVEILQEGGTGGGKNADGTPNEARYKVAKTVSIREATDTKKSSSKSLKVPTKSAVNSSRKKSASSARIIDAQASLSDGTLSITIEASGAKYTGKAESKAFDTIYRIAQQDLAVADIAMTDRGFEVTLLGKGGSVRLWGACHG
jgi:predicted DNA-binding transcriptional regulator YafY